MSLSLTIFWIIGTTSFTLLGSWYARKFKNPDLLIGLYITFILVAQVLAAKIMVFDFGFRSFTVPAGILVYSVTYLTIDIINEKFGRSAAHKAILIAFVSQVSMVTFFWFGVQAHPASFWPNQAAWSQIFGLIPRITFASWAAFLVSENLDAFIYSWFRKVTKGNHLWMRNSLSSIPSLTVDSFIFVTIAFFGVIPLWPIIVGQIVVKWLVGLLNIPFMYFNVWVLREKVVAKDR